MKLDLQQAQEILTLHYLPGLRLALDELTRIVSQLESAAVNGDEPSAKRHGGAVKGVPQQDPNSINNRVRAYLASHDGQIEARDLVRSLGLTKEQSRGSLNYLAATFPDTVQRLSRGVYVSKIKALAQKPQRQQIACPVCGRMLWPEGAWPHIRTKHPEYKGGLELTGQVKHPARDNSSFRTPEFRERMRQIRTQKPHWTRTPEGRERNRLNQVRIAQTPAGRAHIKKMHDIRQQQLRQENKQ